MNSYVEKKECVLLIIGGILKLFDGSSDIIYVSTQSYYSSTLFNLTIIFFFAPSIVLLILYSISSIVQILEGDRKLLKINTIIFFTLLFGEPFGIASLAYGIAYSFKKPGIEKDSVQFMCKLTAILNSLFELVPEIILQIYNSGQLKEISPILIVSCICSGLNILYSFIRIFYDYDKKEQQIKATEMMTASKYLSHGVWRNTDITLEQFND